MRTRVRERLTEAEDDAPAAPRSARWARLRAGLAAAPLSIAGSIACAGLAGAGVAGVVPGAVPLAGASLALALLVLRDATRAAERAKALAAAVEPLAASAGLLRAYETSGEGWFWETDAHGRVTYASPEIAERLGGGASPLGEPLDALVDSGDGATGSRETVAFHLQGRVAFNGLAVRARGDDERWWLLTGAPAHDDHGRFLGFRGSGVDLTEARRSEAEASRAAQLDALTGLPNRRAMRETLEGALKGTPTRPAAPCALLLLDLDRFKSVNDTLGHPIGDALLQLVSQRLTHVVGAAGRVGRLGGDEFNVVVPDTDDRQMLASLADAIIARLSLPYMISGSTISIGASVGIAIAPLDGTCPDELARNADLALYAAKADGKGVHRFYQPQMHAEAKDRRLLETDLREVLDGNQLHLLYQPILDSATQRIVAFEALARWEHPVRGLIAPDQFIPIAEEIGLIPVIGEWVLRTACADAARWPENIKLAVNVSPLQFTSPGLPAQVTNALAAAGLSPDRLEIELTESVFLGEDAVIDAMFQALDTLGVRFALDDFGTGYASLANLKRGPFDKIKIDQSFVRGAAKADGRDAAIIRAIVALAKSLEMETTAEGAESPEDVALIQSLGCSQLQGYLFGKPMSADEAAARAASFGPVPERAERIEREPRRAVLRYATLHSDGSQYPARIRNLSAGGAMIEVEPSHPLANHFAIDISDGQRVEAEVRWANRERVGVQFVERIDVDQVMTQPGVPRWRAGRTKRDEAA